MTHKPIPSTKYSGRALTPANMKYMKGNDAVTMMSVPSSIRCWSPIIYSKLTSNYIYNILELKISTAIRISFFCRLSFWLHTFRSDPRSPFCAGYRLSAFSSRKGCLFHFTEVPCYLVIYGWCPPLLWIRKPTKLSNNYWLWKVKGNWLFMHSFVFWVHWVIFLRFYAVLSHVFEALKF